MIKRIVLIALLLVAAVSSPAGAATQPLNFAVIQPGQPGDSAAAQPVMDALAAYLQQRLANSSVTGNYYNRTDDALAAVAKERPQWAIVSLGIFIEHGVDLAMTPIASTLPTGAEQERFYLLVAKEHGDDWRKLQGRVEGTMLFQDRAVARLLFDEPSGQLPFVLQGTFNPLRAVRKVARGQLAGVILDRLQFQAMQALPLMDQLKSIHCSAELPTAAVVWFGEPDQRAQRLAEVLQAMASDPDAGELLTLLQSAGFAPPDPRLADYRDLLQ